ncbi:DUF2191 domain-containing protein [Bdellovibrionota bacterium FG-1]
MKVTALLPDELINEVKVLSHGKTITEALIIALSEWTSTKTLQALNQEVQRAPLRFKEGVGAAKIRRLNRRRQK